MGILGLEALVIKPLYLFLEPILVWLFSRLPDRVQVRVKARTQVIGRLDYNKHQIWLNVDSLVEYHTRLNSCKKEPETVEWIESFFKEGEVLYDIGANVGAYSLVASKFLGGNVTVYAFEPATGTHAQLCKNIKLNDCQMSIIPMAIALSARTGIRSFHYSNLDPGEALHALGEIDQCAMEPSLAVSVQPVLGYKLDDLVSQFNLRPPNHVKIDVDGSELDVLRGSELILANPSVKSVLVELPQDDAEAESIIELLNVRGFKVHSITGQGLTSNAIFLRGETGSWVEEN